MLEAKARWRISEVNEDEADDAAGRLAAELSLHPLVARLLAVRGWRQAEDARRFLYGGAELFHDPFLLKGMAEAVSRIRHSLREGEKIRIYGDYDADGISSTTLMVFLMKRLGASYDTYIPHRIHEGYGLNREALEQAAAAGVKLIVTVDTGISAKEEIAYAAGLGMDVVVTDHHEPPAELPDQAVALVNPKQPDCPYPCKELAGVGVAFKLAHALLGELPREWLEIAAIGTVADLMPLVDENRLIVKLGLEQMRHTSNLGLKALLDVAGVERGSVNEGHIGFSLAPRINASGRMQHANLAVRLLTTESEQEAAHLAYDLDVLNKERQKTVEDMMKEAMILLDDRKPDSRQVIIAAKEGWNVGVAGIVASKLLERFYRPVIVFAIDGKTGLAKGSARSISGFDIHHALTECSDLLEHFGGHQAAAGLTLRAELIPELERRLSLLAMEELRQEDLTPVIQADLSCSLAETTLPCIEQLSVLAPFGSGNPPPRFMFTKLRVAGKRTMGKDRQHLKLTLEEPVEAAPACSMEAVSFNCGQAAEGLAMASSLDLVGELSVNVWNGSRKPQILIHDMRVSEPQVFDWRGTAGRKGMRPPELPEGSGILIFYRAAADDLPEEWRQFPLWLIEEGLEEDPRPMNRAALLADLRTLRDVVLYTLPSGKESLDKTVALLDTLRRVYAVFADASGMAGARLPDREIFKQFYALIVREKELNSGDARVWPALKKRFGLEEPVSRMLLEIFEELGFVRKEGLRYCAAEAVQKRDLAQSALYRRMMNRDRMEQLYIYSTAAELRELILEARSGGEESTLESKRRMNR